MRNKKKEGRLGRQKLSPYLRGDFWLELRNNSDNYYVFWYNQKKRQYEYKSTRTADLHQACNFLNHHYLEFNDLADTFCGYCGQKVPDGGAYRVIQAIDDYILEVGEKRISEEAIRSRLSHITRFIGTRLCRPEMACAEVVHDRFVESFRDWLQPQAVVWKNGAGEVTKSSPRTRSSVEEIRGT